MFPVDGSAFRGQRDFLHFLISWHDLERWLLKTVKALAASGNLARGRERLSGEFATDVQVLSMLDEPGAWPENTGLYCVMNTGDLTHNHNRFQLVPYTNASDELSGLGVNIMGLDFVLMLEPPDLSPGTLLSTARFRPGQIAITFPNSVNVIDISWDDNRKHEAFSLSFVRNVNFGDNAQ